jgi:hypothetical protein
VARRPPDAAVRPGPARSDRVFIPVASCALVCACVRVRSAPESRMRPSLQGCCLPFGIVSELGNSAGAYCAVAQAQSLSQVTSCRGSCAWEVVSPLETAGLWKLGG